MDIFLAGISASGKWTHSKKLLDYFGWKLKYFETWNILRSLQSSDNAIWNYLKDITANWLLVKDEIVSGLFGVFLETLNDWDFVLADWCLRKVKQTNLILDQMRSRNRDFITIEIVITEDEVYKRLTNRVMCKKCGANFNVLIHGNMKTCSKCGWELYRRNDDIDKHAIENRILAYKNNIVPALDIVDKMWLLRKIDGMKSIDEIFKDILKIISE
jgi:adenylate kinase